jgi:hypothetical protein
MDMDRHQQGFRQEADRAFMESLNQLEHIFIADEPQPLPSEEECSQVASTQEAPLSPLNLDDFEQAAADIEAFLQNR